MNNILKKTLLIVLCISLMLTATSGIYAAVSHQDKTEYTPSIDTGYDNGFYEENSEYDARIGDVYYESIDDALKDAMGKDTTVTVLRDCTLRHKCEVPDHTHLSLMGSNHKITCLEIMFYVYGDDVTLYIFTGNNGSISASNIVYNPYIAGHENNNFNLYAYGNYKSDYIAFYIGNADEVMITADIDARDSTVWCCARGADTLSMFLGEYHSTGSTNIPAIRVLTRDVAHIYGIEATCQKGTALSIVGGNAEVENCKLTGACHYYGYDGWYQSAVNAVIIGNDGCDTTGTQTMEVKLNGNTYGYVDGSECTRPIFAYLTKNTETCIHIICKDPQVLDLEKLSKCSNGAKVWYNGELLPF